MKTTKTTLSVAMAITVATFVLCGCQKDGGGKLESGGFDGRITATIENSVPSQVTRIVPWNDIGFNDGYLTGIQLGDAVTYSGNSFTVTLPNSLPSNVRWVTTRQLFENILGIEGTIKYSDPNVRLADVDFLALNSGLTQLLGYFTHASSDGNMECWFVYAQGDVTVTAGNNLSVSFQEGWNRIYISSKLITTKAQGNMKWYFSDDFS
jgi:hypothetical protein